MRVVNIFAKFHIQPKTQNGFFMVDKGEVKIFGVDEESAALLIEKIPELKFSSSYAAASTSSAKDTVGCLFTRQENGDEMPLDQAIAQITQFLNALDQQEFTIVSSFKDEITDAGNDTQYKVYFWTLQRC